MLKCNLIYIFVFKLKLFNNYDKKIKRKNLFYSKSSAISTKLQVLNIRLLYIREMCSYIRYYNMYCNQQNDIARINTVV